jgi:hypothetical protein
MNAFLRKVATVCVAFLLCASMGTIAFANDLPIYSEWAKAEVSAAENEGLLPFEMYDDCRRALHRDWATAFLVKLFEYTPILSVCPYYTKSFKMYQLVFIDMFSDHYLIRKIS